MRSVRLWSMIARVIALGCCGVAATPANAVTEETANGVWLSQDGDGAIEMFDCAGRLCGRIAWMKSPLRSDGSPERDEHNPEPSLRARPVCGLQIIGDLVPDGPAKWDDGWIYDPDTGKTYHASVTVESASTMRLRGYIGMPLFGESRTWTRAPADLPRCPAG